jgi:hypothetical protein
MMGHGADSCEAIVDFGTSRGSPKQYGSGVLYGIPDTTAWQIPKYFYTEVGINHGRGGGSQVPGKGWVGGEADYVVCSSLVPCSPALLTVVIIGKNQFGLPKL